MKLFGILITAVLLLPGCGNMAMKLPAVAQGENNPRLPGKVIWHDLITDKPAQSIKFYSGLFGWTFEKISVPRGFFDSLSYYVISLNGKVIGGMVDQNDLKADVNLSQWVVAIATDDLDTAISKIVNSGGKIFGEPVDLKNRGRMAVVADAQGGLFALLETINGDPIDRAKIPEGDFLWDELWTVDVDAAESFYKKALPYTALTHDVKASQRNYHVLSAQGEPRAGVMTMPVEGLDPTWVAYLRVADEQSLDAILAKVEALGGSILLPAQDRLVGGHAALISGPSGAGIALQTWTGPASQ